MGPSANDFSNRRRPGRRGDGPARGPGGGPPRDGARGRTGRGLNDPRRPGAASTFRRLGPRPEGSGSGGAGAGGGGASGSGAFGSSAYGSGTYNPSSYGAGSYGPRLGGPRPGGPRPGGPRPGGPRAAGPRANGPRSNGPRPNGPRAAGPGAGGGSSFERRRWTRDRDETSSADTWRRPEAGGGRPGGSPEDRDRPRWRMARRPEGPPGRSFRPVRPDRADGPLLDRDQPQGDAHAAAAPSELIWGRHSAQAALESERPIHRIWCTPEMRFRPTFLQLLRDAKASGALVEEVTWARLGQISGGAVHQGIVLQPAAADTLDLGSLIDGCRALGEAPLLVAVDGLTDPQNLGAILRSAEALGVHGLVLPQRRNAGLTGSVAKVAAGALEHLPVARVVNLNRSLETLREEGYRVVGLDPQGSVSLEDADLEGPLVVITGSEGQGLSVLTRRSCDQLVRIPLRGSTPSLNASVATALVLYEVARRGWMRGLKGTAKPPRLVRPQLPTEALRGEPAVEAADARPTASPVAAPVPPPAAPPESVLEPSAPSGLAAGEAALLPLEPQAAEPAWLEPASPEAAGPEAVSADQPPELVADQPSELAPAQPLASAFPDEPVQPPTPDQPAEPTLSEPAPQASAPPDLAWPEVPAPPEPPPLEPAPPEPAASEPTLSESPGETESSAAPPANPQPESPQPESPQPAAAQAPAAQPPVEAPPVEAPPAPPSAAPPVSLDPPLETFATDISL